MKLKEKLRQNLTGHLSNDKTEVDVNIAAKIADDYAIEFLDFAKSETDYDLWETKFDYKGVLYTSKELLEIFKREKGL
jgi:hypothetical protein